MEIILSSVLTLTFCGVHAGSESESAKSGSSSSFGSTLKLFVCFWSDVKMLRPFAFRCDVSRWRCGTVSGSVHENDITYSESKRKCNFHKKRSSILLATLHGLLIVIVFAQSIVVVAELNTYPVARFKFLFVILSKKSKYLVTNNLKTEVMIQV